MPQVMDLDDPDLVGLADPSERADEVAGLYRPPGPGGENKISVRPGTSHLPPVGGLLLGLVFERFAGEVGQRQVPVARGLDRPQTKLAADPLELLAHVDQSPVEVNVLPPQTEGLAPAKAAER